MSIAVVSYDIKFVENLNSLLKINNVEVYGDSLSLIKEFPQKDFKVIIYDTSSGIFAEDDLKYLIGKLGGKYIKYFVLTVPENPINKKNFSDDIEFISKSESLTILPEILKNTLIQTEEIQSQQVGNLAETFVSEKENETENFENQKFEDLFNKTDLYNIEKDSIDFEPNVISTNEEGIKLENKEESFDNFSTITIPYDTEFENKSTSEEKVEDKSLFEIEFGNIELEPNNISFNEEKEENLLNLDNLIIEKELENFSIEEIGIETKIEENIAKSLSEELNEGIQKYMEGDEEEEIEEEKLKVVKAKEEKKEIITKPLTEFIQEVEKENKITGGEEIMVTNFNITISSEDIKTLAMEMVKDMLKNDNAMNTIIDHLQIDFQDEARRELEEIKNQLKSSLAKEAELMMKEEIERMIKEELKEYVAEITAKIVKEKLDAIFKG
ncbi:hypothetical protein SYO3AOP1_1553 [Sulfurihydrogenibium sp. YO3AOP1]|uniref:hypothetical protein n=1 Tax=Sulfurihydrogenibium sp. (strain YO3AOP1) TaxID=436114 RepID=UPI0001750C81|nr:hypothetical protein [Sulfurihydrogenibium sp. YO3AOP1]ACD67151.1 hypothetical protein SYO3AOP1_1553 [Sulfurihydrogenibium sp. YO3AOP1]